MIIKIADIPPEGRKYSGQEDPSILDLNKEIEIKVADPVFYSVEAQMAADELVVRGKLSVDASFRCSRCGESFRMTVTDPSFCCVRQVAKDQSADLTEEIREAIILSFPNYPVCRSDCKGLCARCGISLNSGKCSCSKQEKKNVWAALDGLELK